MIASGTAHADQLSDSLMDAPAVLSVSQRHVWLSWAMPRDDPVAASPCRLSVEQLLICANGTASASVATVEPGGTEHALGSIMKVGRLAPNREYRFAVHCHRAAADHSSPFSESVRTAASADVLMLTGAVPLSAADSELVLYVEGAMPWA